MILDTPLYGRFTREGRKFLVAAPDEYLLLIKGSWVTGLVLVAIGILSTLFDLGIGGMYWFYVGSAVAAAGALASYSLDFAEFDLRERVYRRRQGSIIGRRIVRGSLNDLQVLTFSAGKGQGLAMGQQIARLTLYWKNPQEPPLMVFNQPVAYQIANTFQPSNSESYTQPMLSKPKSVRDFASVQMFGKQIAQSFQINYSPGNPF